MLFLQYSVVCLPNFLSFADNSFFPFDKAVWFICLYVESFSKHFEKYGAITDSVIMKDKHTKMPRGFGFVTFSDPSVIDKVLEDEHVIDGRTVGHLDLDQPLRGTSVYS
jgi:hypothetical protein